MEREPSEPWEELFADKQVAWGLEPTRSAHFAQNHFSHGGARNVLIPGVGYGRNAQPFLAHDMSVTGIEISETAIALARAQLGLDFPIFHGSVVNMPYDAHLYDGIFCYALIHLLDAAGRAKLISDCWTQLAPGGTMIFAVISKDAPMYGQGRRLGADWYEVQPGISMYFYDDAAVAREFGANGLVAQARIDEPLANGGSLPFINVVCTK